MTFGQVNDENERGQKHPEQRRQSGEGKAGMWGIRGGTEQGVNKAKCWREETGGKTDLLNTVKSGDLDVRPGFSIC